MTISSSLRSRGVRGGAAVAVAVIGVTLAGGGAAHAAPGDSGDIDIRSIDWHSRGGDGVEVCEFVLAASNFESLPAVPWTITAQPPTVPPGDTLQSTLPLINGAARSAKYLLPQGTYQLVWTTPSGPKQKRFLVDCHRQAHHHRESAETGPGRDSQANGEHRRDSESQANGEHRRDSTEIAPSREYQPTGAVPAGGGGVPEMQNVSSESHSNIGPAAALTAGGVGIAALVMARRIARRRARNEA
ncbi:hypothetical protein [Streptomyces sp. NPDC005423]|uniref:hypothetical protein n=1 Tax=Streptomyces sp. NPDC005423 TaxID=3155343 RepID=UPI0033BB2128